MDFGSAQIDQGRLHVSFKLNALQLQPSEVHFCDISHLQLLAADSEHAIVIVKALASDSQHGLLFEHLYEGGAEIEEKGSFLIGQL